VWTLLLIASLPASAQDAHGPVPPPNDIDPLDPILAWSPRVPDAGPAAALLATFGTAPLVHETGDGSDTVRETVLDDVVAGNLAFNYGFGRVGLGVSLPVVMALAGSNRGFGLGSARLAVPISLTTPGETVGFTITPFARGPGVGSASVHPGFLPTGGIALAGGARGDRWA
jgi:hypothetical protein